MPEWIRASATTDVEIDDLIRSDHGGQTFVIIRGPDDAFFAMDAVCSHEQVHLCDGLPVRCVVDCPEHKATFDYRSAEAKRPPACVSLENVPRPDGRQFSPHPALTLPR
jgi:3-phenylpropionate/trans-cinnamate dioxygenase ferredoxin component